MRSRTMGGKCRGGELEEVNIAERKEDEEWIEKEKVEQQRKKIKEVAGKWREDLKETRRVIEESEGV